MIFDHRVYICKFGMVPAHFALYEKSGMACQKRHLGEPVLYAGTEVGNINSFVHIWAYKDLADRTARRAALTADPEWQAFIKASRELGAITEQHNSILVPAPFFKLPGR
jgi:NIPSNAP